MEKTIILNGNKIAYDLQYKKVKNINLRIKSDGKVYVSAPKRVSQRIIETFLVSKADFILKAALKYEKMAEKAKKQYFTEDEIIKVITRLCKCIYPYFAVKGIKYPEIRFRRMVSRWGSCNVLKGKITFNTNLMYAPQECVEYVVVHEFTHFLQANHSKKFYDELFKVCPEWKERRKKLKEINIRLI